MRHLHGEERVQYESTVTCRPVSTQLCVWHITHELKDRTVEEYI